MLFEHEKTLKLSIGYISVKELYFTCKKSYLAVKSNETTYIPAHRAR